SGSDFSDFFAAYVKKPTPINFEAEFKRIGFTLRKGFKKIDEREPERKPSVGLIIRNSGGRFVVDGVLEGSPAENSGISPRDELVAVEGYKFSDRFVKDVSEYTKKLKMDNFIDFEDRGNVKIHYFRGSELRETQCELKPSFPEIYEAVEDKGASPLAVTLREKFFSK
ncbi:MAG: hypothetical protein QXV22_03645, partial [Thermoplasmataceae archaeon]